MNHVSTFFGILVLFLSVFVFSSSSHLIPNGTIIRNHRVSINHLKQEAYLDKSIEESWKYLNEVEEYKNIFSKQEIEVAEDLNRLGISVIVKKHLEGVLKIRYRNTIIIRRGKSDEDEDEGFDELYVCKDVLEKEEILDNNFKNVWVALNRNCLIYSTKLLESFIKGNSLFSSALILKLQGEVFEFLSLEVYSEYIFTLNNTQNVLKYFIFQYNPIGFIDKFLQVFKMDPTDIRLTSLSRILVDLRISDEKVQGAFNFIVKSEYFDLIIPILATFVNSRRPLIIDPNDLNRIILMNGMDNVKERVILIKLLKDQVDFLEKLIIKCFSSNVYSPLLREILFDKELTNILTIEFSKKLLINIIYQDRYNALKFILSSEIMKKMKEGTNNFGLFLIKSIDHVNNLESFKVLINSKMRRTNVPFFNSQDILKTAHLLIKKKIKPKFLEFLLAERFISPNQKVTIDDSGNSENGNNSGNSIYSLSLLAVAVKERNFEFISLLNKINWIKCEDVYKIESIDVEMKSLLISKGAKFIENDDDDGDDVVNDNKDSPIMNSFNLYPSTPHSSPHSPSNPLTPDTYSLITTPMKRSADVVLDLVPNETTTFNTPGVKKQRNAQYSKIPEEYYRSAFESRDEVAMCSILSINEDFKRSYGYIQIIHDLHYVQMIEPLNQLLDNLPVDIIIEVVKEFSEMECEYVIEYLIKNGHFKLDNVCFDGMTLISYLLKMRKANFALNLIEHFKFNLTSTSQDPETNPEGDIILSAIWNLDLVDRLLEMGASPNVKIRYAKQDKVVSLKEYATLTCRIKLLQILEKYHAE